MPPAIQKDLPEWKNSRPPKTEIIFGNRLSRLACHPRVASKRVAPIAEVSSHTARRESKPAGRQPFMFYLGGKTFGAAKKNITFCLYFPKKRYFCSVFKDKQINESI